MEPTDEASIRLVQEGIGPSAPCLHPENQHVIEKQNARLCFWALLLVFHRGAWQVWLDGVFMTVQTGWNYGCFLFLQMPVF